MSNFITKIFFPKINNFSFVIIFLAGTLAGFVISNVSGLKIQINKSEKVITPEQSNTNRLLNNSTLTNYPLPSEEPTVTETILGGLPETPTDTPVVTKGPVKKISVNSWKQYKDHYLEIIVDYPSGWTHRECYQSGSGLGCVAFEPEMLNIPYSTGLITISDNLPIRSDQDIKLMENNLSIQGGGKAEVYKMNDGSIMIKFIHNKITYYLTVMKDYISMQNLDSASVENVARHMVSSITFLNESYSCKNPALTPISSFPDNFTLLNNHDSDGTDELNSFEPYARIFNDKSYMQAYGGNTGTMRVFMVNYVKSGDIFEKSSFNDVVTPIIRDNSPQYSVNLSTEITHINCIDSQEDGPGQPQIFHPGIDESDPFAIHLYGYKINPTTLWGADKWNVNLLKKTRNEVYVHIGNQWQKYKATDYFVSLIQGYGGKPAIYLYPEKKTNVTVKIHPSI